MRPSPQIQMAMLEKAENQTPLDGLIARRNVLPKRAELQGLREKHSHRASEATHSRLSTSDIGRDIAKLGPDIDKLKAREKADRLSLGTAEDASMRRNLERDLRSTKHCHEYAEQKLQRYECMQEAYQADAKREYDADEAHDSIVAAKQRLSDAEVDITTRISIAETRIGKADKPIDGSAAKLYCRLALANDIPVARLSGRACGSCFMKLDIGTVHEFTTLTPEGVMFCPECGVVIVRAKTLGEVRDKQMRQAADKRDSALSRTGTTTDPMRLVLLHHKQSPMSIRRKYLGSRSNPGLTEVGRRQAEAVAHHLAALVDSGNLDFSAVVAFSQHRAQQTAEAVAKAFGLDIRAEEDLRETDFGQWKGMTFSEAHNATPKWHNSWLVDPAVAPLKGEDFHTADNRVSAAHERIAQQFGALDVLVVSHAMPIKSLLHQGLGCGFEIFTCPRLNLAGLSIVGFYADGSVSVRLINDTSYLHDQWLGIAGCLNCGCGGYANHSGEPVG